MLVNPSSAGAQWSLRQAQGWALAEPVHYDGRAETEALKARYTDWLKGK